IGSPGSGEGEFHGVQGVAFDAEGDIYAVDSGNHRVQKFSRDGVYLLQFGRRGQYEGEFTNPTDVAVDGDSVFVTDTGSGRILVFDASGNYMREIKNDMLTAPRGITVSGGLLYVSDSDTGLAIIDPATGDGRLIDSWRDGEETFSRLYASVIDRDGYLYLLDHNLQSVIAFSEIEQTYTNIDIEIRSVDTASYPTIAFYLSVRNRGGTPLYALSAENFTVFEDNARMQRLSIDYLKERPKRSTAVFCVDRSASMKQWHDELQWSADFYFKNMTVEDRVRIVNAGVRDWVGNDFDWSRRRAQQALRQQRYEGDTPALGRVLYNAVSELVDTESSRAVVLFTDGNQTDAAFAQYPPGVIADYARAHYIPVYIISLDADNDTLRMIARSSGGAFIRAREAEQLQDLYTDIRSQEEYRYVLVYESFKTSGFTGWWSDVTVDVESQGRRGREWGGYFVP
ncbi:MAG: VWA domain-containing protein, partial [Spirochaetota bacterium]